MCSFQSNVRAVLIFLQVISISTASVLEKRPNIVLIVADDVVSTILYFFTIVWIIYIDFVIWVNVETSE